MHRSRNCAGFTLLEASLASVFLGMLLLGGVLVSRSSMAATQETVEESARASKYARPLDEFDRRLMSASHSSFLGVPEGGVPEPMLEDVPYQEIRFRRVVAVYAGDPVYDPPLGTEPYRLWFQPGPQSGGDLMFQDGENAWPLCKGIAAVEMVRIGNRLSLRLERAYGEEGNGAPDSFRSVVLRVP